MAADRGIAVTTLVGGLSVCLLQVVMSQHVDVDGNCSRTDRPEPMEIWGVERGPLTCTMLGTSSCEGGVLPPEVQGDFMGRPEFLSVEGALVPGPSGDLNPQIVFTWEPPAAAAGFEHLKGFYVEIYRFSGYFPGPTFYCRVFDFSQNNFTSQDYKLKFKKKMVGFPGGTNFLYRMEMYTLPMSPESRSRTEFFTLQPLQDGSSTASWSASVSYEMRTLTDPADITVHFSLAPSEYNFRKYTVELVGDHDDKNVLIGCEVDTMDDYSCQGINNPKPAAGATTVSHTFHDLGPGSYRVWITPVDPYWQTDGECLCYERTSINHTVCLRCITTSTGNITVEGHVVRSSTSSASTSSTSTSSTSTSSTSRTHPTGPTEPSVEDIRELPDDVVTSLASLFGSLFGLFLVGIVVMGYRRQRASALRVKSLYLLYTDDHKDHSDVINKLAIYLRDYCYCEVFYVPWFRGTIQTTGTYQWILSHIDFADFVLIISSEAAFMLFDARNTNTSFRAMDGGPEGDTFSPAVSHIMARSSQRDFHKKTILAHFEYTGEEFAIKEISPGVNYQLPKYFKELLCHIHEVEMCGKTPKQAKINAMGNLQASQCGRSLLDAVVKATHYQKACPHWFVQRFQRQDSAYSSQYDHVGDSVSCAGFYRVDANHNNYDDDDDEMRSTVTYDTTYARDHEMFPPSEVPTDTPTEFINMQLQNITMQSMGLENVHMQSVDMQNVHMQNVHMQSMDMQNVPKLTGGTNQSSAVHTHGQSPPDDVFTPPSDVDEDVDEDVDVDVDVDEDVDVDVDVDEDVDVDMDDHFINLSDGDIDSGQRAIDDLNEDSPGSSSSLYEEDLEELPVNVRELAGVLLELMSHARAESTNKKYQNGFAAWKKWAELNNMPYFALAPFVANIKSYGLHSLRSGGASAAANNGIPDRMFKRHGRWKSENAEDGYIKDSIDNKMEVSLSLGL
ncbi:uncharacterized protein [Haliotis asinina]|uniref:uncharacterized protein n=1 Tax=Haliotis asinina TaxID=109174 RepID=UPI00353230F7